MSNVIEVRGLKELMQRMAQYPDKLKQQLELGMKASLLALWGSVPPYPPPPPDSTYRRTGTLGRTLGVGQGGGQSGKPEIYQVRKLGQGIEGRFGTNLDYAPHVIGEGTQSIIHQGRWWTLKNIAEAAADKIKQVWNGIGENMARFLDGKG